MDSVGHAFSLSCSGVQRDFCHRRLARGWRIGSGDHHIVFVHVSFADFESVPFAPEHYESQSRIEALRGGLFSSHGQDDVLEIGFEPRPAEKFR